MDNDDYDDDDDEEEDEDEEYDEEDEDDDDDEGNFDFEERPVAMSASLMRALGMEVPDEEESLVSDWKPPEKAGLEFSERIIQDSSFIKTTDGFRGLHEVDQTEFENSRFYQYSYSAWNKSVADENKKKLKALQVQERRKDTESESDDDDDEFEEEDREVYMSVNLIRALNLDPAKVNHPHLNSVSNVH